MKRASLYLRAGIRGRNAGRLCRHPLGSQGVGGLRPARDPVRDGANHPRNPGTDSEDDGRAPSDAAAGRVFQPPRPEIGLWPVREGGSLRLVHGPGGLERHSHPAHAPLVFYQMASRKSSREAVLLYDGRPEVPVLIPCGIDQDPHFRITRDVAPKLGYPKPALIHNKLLPSLLGPGGKMSASIPESSIFTTDTEAQARKKVMNAFTGGRATVEEQRRLGANPYICSIFAQYNYIFEPDDKNLAIVEETCKSGARLCGDCKAELWDKIRRWLKTHHEAREKARDHVEEFVIRD